MAELTGRAAGFDPAFISPVIGPLYEELISRLESAGVKPVGHGIAYYEDGPDDDVLIHAALPVNAEPADLDVRLVDLPEIATAATIVHRGSMDDVLSTIQTLGPLDRCERLPVRRLQPRAVHRDRPGPQQLGHRAAGTHQRRRRSLR